jgi:hypothetical protein
MLPEKKVRDNKEAHQDKKATLTKRYEYDSKETLQTLLVKVRLLHLANKLLRQSLELDRIVMNLHKFHRNKHRHHEKIVHKDVHLRHATCDAQTQTDTVIEPPPIPPRKSRSKIATCTDFAGDIVRPLVYSHSTSVAHSFNDLVPCIPPTVDEDHAVDIDDFKLHTAKQYSTSDKQTEVANFANSIAGEFKHATLNSQPDSKSGLAPRPQLITNLALNAPAPAPMSMIESEDMPADAVMSSLKAHETDLQPNNFLHSNDNDHSQLPNYHVQNVHYELEFSASMQSSEISLSDFDIHTQQMQNLIDDTTKVNESENERKIESPIVKDNENALVNDHEEEEYINISPCSHSD